MSVAPGVLFLVIFFGIFIPHFCQTRQVCTLNSLDDLFDRD